MQLPCVPPDAGGGAGARGRVVGLECDVVVRSRCRARRWRRRWWCRASCACPRGSPTSCSQGGGAAVVCALSGGCADGRCPARGGPPLGLLDHATSRQQFAARVRHHRRPSRRDSRRARLHRRAAVARREHQVHEQQSRHEDAHDADDAQPKRSGDLRHADLQLRDSRARMCASTSGARRMAGGGGDGDGPGTAPRYHRGARRRSRRA